MDSQLAAVGFRNSATYLQVNQIINPDKKGGTGNFQVRSRKGSNTIDENLIFGTIGMGQYPNQLTSTTIKVDTVGGSANAGETSFYVIGFKTISFVPKGSYFRVTLPSGKGYSVAASPTCAFLPVLGITPTGTLSCTASNGVVIMRGLAQDLFKGTVMSIRLQITNPQMTVSSPKFRVEIIRDKTQYVYDWIDSLVGPDILPGKLSSVVVAPNGALADLAIGKTETLSLTFTTKNPIPKGGMITIAVPTSFAFVDLSVYDKPITYYVVSGLTASNASIGVNLTYVDSTTT